MSLLNESPGSFSVADVLRDGSDITPGSVLTAVTFYEMIKLDSDYFIGTRPRQIRCDFRCAGILFRFFFYWIILALCQVSCRAAVITGNKFMAV